MNQPIITAYGPYLQLVAKIPLSVNSRYKHLLGNAPTQAPCRAPDFPECTMETEAALLWDQGACPDDSDHWQAACASVEPPGAPGHGPAGVKPPGSGFGTSS